MTGRCRAVNAAGERCKVEGHLVGADGRCAMHSDPTLARRAGKEGAQATREQWARPGIDPDEMPELVDHESAKKFLEIVARAAATKRLSHNEANATVRALAEWLKAHADSISAEVVTKLRRRVEELEAELGRRSKVKAVR